MRSMFKLKSIPRKANFIHKQLKKLTALSIVSCLSLFTVQVFAANLASPSTFVAKSDNWQSSYLKAFDGNVNNEARAKVRGTSSDVWLAFKFDQNYKQLKVSFLEDNQYPYAVSRWKVQGWQSNKWVDIDNWQAHNSKDYTPIFPIANNYSTRKIRILFQAGKDQKVGLNEVKITGTPSANTSTQQPVAIVDSHFYTPPSQYDVTYNLVNDYGVNNHDLVDDSDLLQKAIDDISNQPNGGKLIIPAGKYYFLNIKMRSNVNIIISANATIFPTPNHDGKNHRIFEVGTQNSPKVDNFSVIGRGQGFKIDFSTSTDKNLAVFNLGDTHNFKISNFTIEDNKTIFASFLIGVTKKANKLYWPVDGIIEKVTQHNALFGYGIIQTYGADNILFRDLDGEGGITLRMETDNLLMKELKQGGIRDIYAENIKCTNGLAAVMFGPHFMKNGAVQVNNVESRSCGFAVRVDKGFVELFSPNNQDYTRNGWKAAVEADIGVGCAATPYARGNNGTRWAARINDVNDCLDVVYNKHGLKPGSFEKSDIYNVSAYYGTNAQLKQDQLDYFETVNPTCNNVCLPTNAQWPKKGQIYIGSSLAGVINKNISGKKYNFDINVHQLNVLGFPNPHHTIIDTTTPTAKVCNYYGMDSCSNAKW